MRRRTGWRTAVVGVGIALVCAAVLAAWGWRPRGQVTLLAVVTTSVNVSDRDEAPPAEAVGFTPAAPRIDAAGHELVVGALPWSWRWSPWLVTVRDERFLRVAGSAVHTLRRLPAHVPVRSSAFSLLDGRGDGSLRLRVADRERWLGPGSTWAALFVGDDPPLWSDGDPDLWREALSAGLAARRPVTVWRFTAYGLWSRRDVRLAGVEPDSADGAIAP